MSDRYLRRREVEREVALSRSSIYRKMEGGKFPRPRQISPGCVRWLESDIQNWKRQHASTS